MIRQLYLGEVLLIAACVLSLVPSCGVLTPASPAAPDPLQATAAAVSAAGAVITREVRAAEGALLADIRARRLRCPAAPPEPRAACLSQARQEALAAAAPRLAQLTEAASVQRAAAVALEEVDRCRRAAAGGCADHEAAALAVAAELAPLLPALTGGHP